MKRVYIFSFLLCAATSVAAQNNYGAGYQQIDENGHISSHKGNRDGTVDSSGIHREIPKGLKVWTVDERFGDRTPAQIDTLSHMYMNSTFTTGLYGEYNTTGNMGAPRINRIFIDRPEYQPFIFTQPYDFFVKPISLFHFTNTYSPITNITLNSAGDRTNGEDDFKAIFAVTAGKKIGIGFRFDYKYGRGCYSNQSTSHFGYTMWGSYIGNQYQAHMLLSTNHQKVTENGGITNDNYITHPENFNEDFGTDEIPTVLQKNWNRNDNQHFFLSHRYSLGFNRKVPMTKEEINAKKFAIASKKENEAQQALKDAEQRAHKEGKNFDEKSYNNQQTFSGRPDGARIAGDEPDDTKTFDQRIAVTSKAMADSLIAQEQKQQQRDTSWTKNEYVPVTSFIHTLKIDNYRRIYQAYNSPKNYYLNEYHHFYDGTLRGDSIYDRTQHYEIKNTLAIALLEGFNKWAKAGIKVFASHDLLHFELPNDQGGTSKYNEHTVSVGGQLSKNNGQLLHYVTTAEIGVAGEEAGMLRTDGKADINFRLLGDTIQLAAKAFLHRECPGFYFRHYHARHLWWDQELSKEIHSRIEGLFTLKNTGTQLRVALDELKNYTYFKQTYQVSADYKHTGLTISADQESSPISMLTASLAQNFILGPLHWENIITYQKSSKQEVLPVPTLNIYTNLFLKFRIAHVLQTELGTDMRYFTAYEAPEYAPSIGQYAVQGDGTNQKTKIGNYPLFNAYANFHLKHTRFFVMYSHVNSGSFNRSYFYTPHYPLNQRIFRFGISWNFFN